MGIDCEDAFIFAFVPSQSVSLLQRRVGIPHSLGNTWSVLTSTVHKKTDLQSSHFCGSYNKI